MSDLTSEQIAKALKGSGLTTEQRIVTATEAWQNETIFFPNKDDFLFEWLCTSLTKYNQKRVLEAALLQLPYWRLLQILLRHYRNKAESKLKVAPPVVRVHLIVAIATLFQHLQTITQGNVQQRSEFLQTVHACLEDLFSDAFALSYRAASEHMSIAVEHLLDALCTQIEQYEADNAIERQALDDMIDIALILLHRYDLQLVQAANQKKMFTAILGKSFSKYLFIFRHLQIEDDAKFQAVTRQIADILSHALFHRDMVLEYIPILKGAAAGGIQKSVKQTSYVVNLFEELTAMVQSTKDEDQKLNVLYVLPVLLRSFLSSYRKKRSVNTAALQDQSRQVEFGFFSEAYHIASTVKCTDPSVNLSSYDDMLKCLVDFNVYSTRNDTISKTQQQVLQSIATDIVKYLQDSQKYAQALVFNLANTVLQIDFAFVESHMYTLWPIMLTADKNAEASCLRLAFSILRTYSASRQLDDFVRDILTAIDTVTVDDINATLSKPLFSREFLKEFSTCVSKQMPAAQASIIFQRFADELRTAKDTASDAPATKKRKHAKKSTPRKHSSARLISTYMAEFISALHLTHSQEDALQPAIANLFSEYIQASLQQENQNLDDAVLPALQIHFTLTNALFRVYWQRMDVTTRQAISKSIETIFTQHLSCESLSSRIAVVISANALLQHVYYTCLLANIEAPSSDQSTDIWKDTVGMVLGAVIDNKYPSSADQAVVWDGRLLNLQSKEMVNIACYQILLTNWFDVICRFIDSSRAEKLATVLFLSTSESPSSVINGVNTVSLQSLSKTLLRSANFYEARCFKECAVSIIVQAIADHFRTLSSKETHSTVLISFISHISSSKPVVLSSDIMAEIESVMDETFTQMNEDIKQEETTKLDKVATLINLLLLMPMDYYSRQERQNILVLVCLVDVWTFSLGGADLNCKLKTSSICRALNARITQFTHTLGFLNQRPKFVNWFVRSYDCLQRSLNQELDSELLHSWKSVSKNLDQQNLSILCTMASAKVKDENHIVLFKDTLNQRMQSLRDSKVVFEMINFDSILNALEVLNNNLKVHVKRQETIDLTHAIYASDFMSYIAGYVNESLQEFTSVIVMLAQKVTESGEGAQNEDVMRCALNVALFRPVLEATRWLQEYAQILIPHGDQVVQAKELSDSLIAVASPFMQFLQAYLARISDDVLFTNALAESTIAFVGALCVTLSRYQEIDATKRILATIWFVYGLIAESGNRVAVQALDDTFTSWFESLPKHQFEVLVQSFLEQIEEETERRLDVEREGHRKICISLLVSLIKKSTSSQKFQLRKLTSRIGLSLMKLAETTTSLDLFCRIMDLLNCMASDPSLEFSRYDLSLVLACLVQIGSESALDRFRSQMTRTIAHELFNKVCSSLMSLAVFHRDQLINNMTPYMALLQSLLHCFKSTHMALVSNKSKKKSGDTQESMRHARVIPLLFEYAPLDESSAHIYSRTLKTIPRKSDKTTKSNTQTIYRSLSKHMPYLLLEYFTIQTNVTMSISRPEIKAALVSGLYDIMDMCNENDRTLIMTCLNAPGKTLFKTFYTNWKEDHKYTGQ